VIRRGWWALALTLGACKPSDGTGPVKYQPPPGVNLRDPSAVITGIAGFEGSFGVPAVRSVTGLASQVSIAGAPPVPGGTALCGAGAPPAPFGSSFGVVPDSELGRIFVYDSLTAGFRVGADSGGPAGGVEFVLPTVDSLGRVRYPLQTAGSLDLFDVTPSGGMLTLHSVVTGTGTLGDYLFVDSGTATEYSGILTGRMSGPGGVFGFRDSTTGLYQQITAAAVITDSGTGAQMILNATRTATDPYDNFYDLDFTFRSAAEKVRVLGNITTYCLLPSIGLTVSVNDTDFAIINGSTGPVITGLADSTLTPQQDSAILALIRGQGEMFSWLTALAQPTKQFLP